MFLRSQQMAGLYNRKTTGDLCAVAAGGKENTWYEGKYQGYFASHQSSVFKHNNLILTYFLKVQLMIPLVTQNKNRGFYLFGLFVVFI